MTSKTVIFNHIPKTAGLTLSSILEKQYPKDKTFSTLGWKGGRREAIDYFRNLSDFERNQFDLITGHSALELFNDVEFPIVLIMLRDPVDRISSLYSYVRRKSWHNFHQITNQYSLSECFENNIHNKWRELSNGQFSSLLNCLDKINMKVSDNDVSDIEKVKLFLKNYCIVGLTEKFNESLILFTEHLNLRRNLYYYKINVSRKKVDINHEMREIILEYNKMDYDLYKFSVEYFDVLTSKINSNFKKKVQYFKLKNGFVMPILVFKSQLNYFIRKTFNKVRSKFIVS